MKPLVKILFLVGLAGILGLGTLGARPGDTDPQDLEDMAAEMVTPSVLRLQAWLDERRGTTLADLTVGELDEYADMLSVIVKERKYVMGAAIASFILPGAGQFAVGDALGGSLHLVGQGALTAGTLVWAWNVLPEDLRNSSLSYVDWHDRFRTYLESDPAALGYSFGVLAGGFFLSVAHGAWAATDAKDQAMANLEAGKVTFEPVPVGMGIGLRLRM